MNAIFVVNFKLKKTNMNFLIGKVFDEHYRKEIVKIESARWVHGFFG